MLTGCCIRRSHKRQNRKSRRNVARLVVPIAKAAEIGTLTATQVEETLTKLRGHRLLPRGLALGSVYAAASSALCNEAILIQTAPLPGRSAR